MKKTIRRLQFNREAIRTLTAPDLRAINGGESVSCSICTTENRNSCDPVGCHCGTTSQAATFECGANTDDPRACLLTF
jgi:hypothetical protein